MLTDVMFTSADGTRLSGSLATPTRAESVVAGLVFVSGSGPSDRHNGGLFDDLSEQLTERGLAVLTYDKRGLADSTRGWASAGVDALAADARGAVALLRGDRLMSGRRIGLFGHSEGGWVALRAATRPEAPDFLVLNSCPAVSFLRAEVHALTAAGVDPDLASQTLHQLAALATAGGTHLQAKDILGQRAEPAVAAAAAAAGFEMTEETWAQFTAWLGYEPAGDLSHLRLPTLAVFGDQDTLTPVRASVARLQDLADHVVQAVVFPHADHRIRVNGRYADGYFRTLVSWCTDITSSTLQ